MGSLG
jgi:dynein heavy chain, axonemal